ncbi:ATPase [Actibacterium mucosum KCTC 23349]|uniref:histidine kinase n=1 Tax=Actibacterium mucosum KCTC 23349 TaxID=1454373 RepID=A0A037ZK69_9RHOB|nr:ATP-binding protein [Actibacterium mucosum]KAJ56826.1 ATPase [Actibacterium mucosum KCTC 23349]
MTPDALKNFVEAIPLPSVYVGPDERVAVLNTPGIALFGDSSIGRHYVTALRNPALLDSVEESLRLGQSRRTRYLTTDMNREATYDVRCSPVTVEGQGGALLCFEDISAREQAEQIRRDFVANVSHELKTPLTAVLGFIETIRGPAKDDAEARDRFLEIMSREAERMNRLVRDLLSLSRVESDERVRPAERVDLVSLVQSAVLTLRPFADENAVEIIVEGDDAPIFAPGDSDQLTQVFTNLIENGVKYGASGKTVRIEISASEREMAFRGPGIRIDVVDQGEGIDPVHIPRLTERFYRVDGHRSREMGGTGLGLAIVKHIINRHRGRFRIESIPGKGSRFSVMLPVR